MKFFAVCLLLLSCVFSSNVRSRSSEDYDGDLERPEDDQKRSRSYSFSTPSSDSAINNISHSMNSIVLSDGEGFTDLSSRISSADYPEMFEILKEIIENDNLEEFKLVHKMGKLSGHFFTEQIKFLCTKTSPNSTKMLEFFIFIDEIYGEFNQNLAIWLKFCSTKNLEKFFLLWDVFDGGNVPDSELAEVIAHIASENDPEEVYDFILNELEIGKRKSCLDKALLAASHGVKSMDALEFFIRKNVSFESLPLFRKQILLKNAAIGCNKTVTEYIINDTEMFNQLKSVTRGPWVDAILNDHHEILDIYMKKGLIKTDLTENNNILLALIYLSFEFKRISVLEYFKLQGFFTKTVLETIAKRAMERNNVEVIKLILDFEPSIRNGEIQKFLDHHFSN